MDKEQGRIIMMSFLLVAFCILFLMLIAAIQEKIEDELSGYRKILEKMSEKELYADSGKNDMDTGQQ